MVACGAFTPADIAPFLALADRQGWLSEAWELEFLLDCFPQGCFVCREDGLPLGYITSIGYGRSGWLGNLLVRPGARRRGIGRGLLEQSVSALHLRGVETLWLTASEEGAGLYRDFGFSTIDTVCRWAGKGAALAPPDNSPLDIHLLSDVDRAGWGDPREALLQITCGRGQIHTSPGGFLCCQQWPSGTQIGPWSSLTGPVARQLLDRVLIGGEGDLFLDVPAGNLAAAALLKSRGFTVKGKSALMYLGARPLYLPGNIYALASMGSMG
jgi:ribosomal protein S18 acetylase RimI-like enzyme